MSFTVVTRTYIVYCNVYCDYICMKRAHMYKAITCSSSELHAHLCSHRNVWCQVVYCRLQQLLNCLHVCIIRAISFSHFTKFCIYLLVSEMANVA